MKHHDAISTQDICTNKQNKLLLTTAPIFGSSTLVIAWKWIQIYWTRIISNATHKLKYDLKGKQTQTEFEYVSQHIMMILYILVLHLILVFMNQNTLKTHATTSIIEPNAEVFNVIGAVVIDIHRRTQTENTLFDHFFHCHFRCGILQKTTFFSLCS